MSRRDGWIGMCIFLMLLLSIANLISSRLIPLHSPTLVSENDREEGLINGKSTPFHSPFPDHYHLLTRHLYINSNNTVAQKNGRW
jgi:hypothetical protein